MLCFGRLTWLGRYKEISFSFSFQCHAHLLISHQQVELSEKGPLREHIYTFSSVVLLLFCVQVAPLHTLTTDFIWHAVVGATSQLQIKTLRTVMCLGQLLTSVEMLQTYSNSLKTVESEHGAAAEKRGRKHPGIVMGRDWTQLQDTPGTLSGKAGSKCRK